MIQVHPLIYCTNKSWGDLRIYWVYILTGIQITFFFHFTPLISALEAGAYDLWLNQHVTVYSNGVLIW